MIDKKYIGYNFKPVAIPVEEGRLKFLAKALGETKGIYIDPEAAKTAGLPGLLAPPTFPFMLEIDALDLVNFISVLGEPLEKLLHGEENFNYYAPIYAGDSIIVRKTITDIIDKKGGALQFVISDNSFTNQHGIIVAETRTNYIFRYQ